MKKQRMATKLTKVQATIPFMILAGLLALYFLSFVGPFTGTGGYVNVDTGKPIPLIQPKFVMTLSVILIILGIIMISVYFRTQSKNPSPSPFIPGKNYCLSYSSLRIGKPDANANSGYWCHATPFEQINDNMANGNARYLPADTTEPERILMNVCNWYCDNKPYSALITTNKPLGFGEYAVWMKNSVLEGVITTFYLSQKYSEDTSGMPTNNKKTELDWEVTSYTTDPYNQLIIDNNIYFYDEAAAATCLADPTTTCEQSDCIKDREKCAQPNVFPMSYTAGNPTMGSDDYTGALQYIIGYHSDKIEFKLQNAKYQLLYLRTIDFVKNTDIATFYDPATQAITSTSGFTTTNIAKIKQLYQDESILYPYLNTWCPEQNNWLTINQGLGDHIYKIASADTPNICSECVSCGDNCLKVNDQYTQMGAQSIYFGPMVFTPDADNKIFNAVEWNSNVCK